MQGYTFGILETVFIAINVLVSLVAFSDREKFDKLSLHVHPILANREYIRLLTSGFIHVNGAHLFFNMLAMVFFAGQVESAIGSLSFALIYLASLVGGNLLALFIHRNHPEYRAVGASGAVSGIVFCAIALFKGMSFYPLFIRIPIPAWFFGMGFIAYSVYGMYKNSDNIGHEAHLGGAIFGLLGAVLLVPRVLDLNGVTIGLVSIPILLFIVILSVKPQWLIADVHAEYEKYSAKTIDDEYNEEKWAREQELNRILDKLQQHGPESLTKEEERYLKDFS